MINKLACNMNLNDMTKVFDKLSVNSKKMANQLVNSGLTTDVNPQFINKNMPDFFEKSGELTNFGRFEIIKQLKRFGLDAKATVDDFYKGLLNSITNPPIK
ncbi:MAG: hypothetical protein ACLSWI_00415 [Candidatus Gastranaerophilaceae bacterium]